MLLLDRLLGRGAGIPGNADAEKASRDLWKAIVDRDIVGVDIALSNGADPNFNEGVSTGHLHLATILDRVDIMRKLIAHGAKLEGRDEGGLTPLHCAAGGSLTDEPLRFLLKAGADVNVRANDGHTPIQRTVGVGGQLEKAKLLLRAGADTRRLDRTWLLTVRRAIGDENQQKGRP